MEGLTMYWDDVLKEVLNRNSRTTFLFTNLGQSSHKKKTDKKREARKMYNLGKSFEGTHFSKREAECMVYLLKGKSSKNVAKKLKLSPRTVEYYIENMKKKLKCRTKFELVDLVMDSDFLSGVDFA